MAEFEKSKGFLELLASLKVRLSKVQRKRYRKMAQDRDVIKKDQGKFHRRDDDSSSDNEGPGNKEAQKADLKPVF